MDKLETDELNCNLKKLIDKNKFDNKYIVLFGANIPASKTIQYLKSKNISVNAIIDNKKNKKNAVQFDVEIFYPEELLGNFNDNVIILIASKYYNEMCIQLDKMGYKKNVHIFSTIKYSQYSNSLSNFFDSSKQCYNGYKVYKKIRKEYGYDKTIFIFPYAGTGDIYVAGLYIKYYLQNNKIDDYITTVIGKSCVAVAEMFKLKNIVKLEYKESTELVNFNNIFDDNSLNMIILHCDFRGVNSVFNNLRNYCKLYLTHMFKYGVFNLNENCKKIFPDIVNKKDYVINLFNEKNLQKQKTVILAPYANTLMNLSMKFWENISEVLKKNGYTVCTNCYGNEESAIPNTTAIFFPLNYAVDIVEYAGYFLGIRSGLCDIIANTNCKKIILYPVTDIGVGVGDAFEYFSLRNMNLCTDVEEIKCIGDRDILIKNVTDKINTYFV